MNKPRPVTPQPSIDPPGEPSADMTLNDVVGAIKDLQDEVAFLRRRNIGGIGDTFWGVAFGVVVGVPLVAIVAIIVLALTGSAIAEF